MELPPKILDTLTCTHCDNLLSIFPINLYENGGQVCGRCKLQSSDARRMLAYESVAAFISFPCKNKKLGCTFATTPHKMVNHESTCSYKPYDCFENCTWQGILKHIKSHYEETHKDLVKTTDEFFEHEGKDCRALVVAEDDVFLFQLKAKRMGFTADVYLLTGKHTSDYYMYELHFRWFCNSIVSIQGREVKSISEFTARGTVVDGIDLNKSIACRIKLLTLPKVKATLSQADSSIADQFLCKSCKEYITPPVNQCLQGHLVCTNHWTGGYGHYCHSCESYITKVRRCSLLDDVATSIKYPCIYPGCNSTFSITERAHHEKVCRFKTFNCPFTDCAFDDEFDLIVKHLGDKHEGKYFVNAMTAKLSDERRECSVVVQNGSIFEVRTWFGEESLEITVDPYGPKHTNSRFMFELRMENLDERVYFKTSKHILLPNAMFTGDHSCWVYTVKIIEL